MIVNDFVNMAVRRLEASGIESPFLEAQLLAAHVVLKDRSWVLSHPHDDLPEHALEALLCRRENHEPLAYILGWREFYGRRFAVRKGVLIPRQETETIVETALRLELPESAKVLDMGTGSGILAVTLALEKPDWQVSAVDVSMEALAVATDNAQQLKAEVEFVMSDAFEAIWNRDFDLIVSNPPYVASDAGLAPEIAEHEPSVALFAGDSGLEFYELLAKDAPMHVRPGGFLVVELGDGMLEAVRSVFEHEGWKVVDVVKDLLAIDRCLVLGR